MHYVLYRKYRPVKFSEVIGQEHVTNTLRNQIKSGQFAHAYLFTGTRGTGKTTCAKIFARAVNCLAPADGEPCNECEVCKGLLNGDIYDVSEIDAASNNSVDNIRQIREEILYSPVKTKYKVYIIDEVHMLSQGAFNALLKTLEEPPSHALFVLATTEAHKVPATILSRCQRFDMHRLNIKEISEHLNNVIIKEGRQMPGDIVNLIATLADGSLRDGFSILDKVLELQDPNEIKNVLGVCDVETLFSLSAAISAGDIDMLYSSVAQFYTSSRDFGILCHDLLSHFRFLLICKTSEKPENTIEKTDEEINRYKERAKSFSVEHILYIMDLLQQTIQNLARSVDKRADTEICLLRCANPSLNENCTALLARIKKLEDEMASNLLPDAEKNVQKPKIPVDIEKSVQKQDVKKLEKLEKIVSPLKEEISEELPVTQNENISEKTAETNAESIQENDEDGYKEYLSWDVITSIIKQKDLTLSLTLSHSCQVLYKGKTLLILCSRKSDLDEINTPQSRALIMQALEEDRKTGYKIQVEIGNKNKYLDKEQQAFSDIYNSIQDSSLFQF